jgi:hypothetical protein
MSDAQPSNECIAALLELQRSMSNYRAYGHGHFVWKAFAAMREADRYMVEHPGLAINVDMHRETVLAAVEQIARGMLELGEVTSDAGRKQLLNALKWADKGIASSTAREKEQEVISRLRVVFSTLLNYSDAKLAALSDPVWKDLKSFDGAYQLVADATGESKSNVVKIWKEFTSVGFGAIYQRDAEAAIEKRKKDIAARRKPRMRAAGYKPVKPAQWR